METKLNTIDPNQNNVPETAVIQRVASESDRLPNGEHEKAVKAFYFSDSIASGIGKDFAFVEKIPQLINEIIDNKSWECLYVSKSVVTPYYCRYTKGTDSENFRAFITAKRPNGLGTTIETLNRLLEADLEVRGKFRTIIYESRQGERTDLEDNTSRSHCGKLGNLSSRQQENIRAANRAAEAIPEVGELLDRGLIAIDVAAKLGRDIKDPDNLNSEEREYVDKRDLIGIRIRQYIYTNTIPEDEDKEPAYSRKLNEFVKDLLGIKNRSKTVRMDNPKKAAEKLLKFYEGQKLQELLKYLQEGLQSTKSSEPISSSTVSETKRTSHGAEFDSAPLSSSSPNNSVGNQHGSGTSGYKIGVSSSQTQKNSLISEKRNKNKPDSTSINNREKKSFETTLHNQDVSKDEEDLSKVASDSSVVFAKNTSSPMQLTRIQLGERLGLNPKSISNFLYRQPNEFSKWTQKKDPEGLAWQKTEKKGRSYFFTPVQTTNEE